MNFVFVCPDEMRAQSVGCYGHPTFETPHIDRLAAEGTRFTQAHCQHTVCSPSRCSFLTGWYPHTAGHRSLWHLLRPHEPNLFKTLKQAGYEVYWIGKNDTFSAEAAAQSVSRMPPRDAAPTNPAPPPQPAYEQGEPGYYSFLCEPMPDGVEDGDAFKTRLAEEYLRAGPPEPFAINLNLGKPHAPYRAPQPWHDKYDPEALPPLITADESARPPHHELIRRYRRLDEADERVLRKVNAVYGGMIGYVDALLGRLLDTLEETGHAEDTAVVFFSDHGDYAGDYGLVEKWTSGLEDVLTRVPLIIRAPGGAPGHVVEEPVELFDITPTVLELAGVDSNHVHFARSLVPQLQGATGDPDRAVFAEGGYDRHEPHCFEGVGKMPVAGEPQRAVRVDERPEDWANAGGDPASFYYPKFKQQLDHRDSIRRCAMIRTMRYKLIRRPGGVHELYDLDADPGETHNAYGERAHAEAQAELEERLLDWYLLTSDAPSAEVDARGMPDLSPYGIQG